MCKMHWTRIIFVLQVLVGLGYAVLVQTVQQNPIRLVGGKTQNTGRLEVYHDGQWGTVCDDTVNDQEASAICQLLGYSAGTSRPEMASRGSGQIWLSRLECPETVTDISQCGSSGWGGPQVETCKSYYGHDKDLRLLCTDVICDQNYTVAIGSGNCIRYFPERKSWQDAETACVAEGGHLLSIHSREEQDGIAVVLPPKKHNSYNEIEDVWIGLNDISNEGVPAWSDGSSRDYTNYDQGEPNNGCGACSESGASDCFRMYPASFNPPHTAWEWGDKPCQLTARFVCQKQSSCSTNHCLNGGVCSVSSYGVNLCKCPDGYIGETCDSRVFCSKQGFNITAAGDKCLKYFSEYKTFDQAEAVCVTHGGHLASIHSLAEQEEVASLFPTDYSRSFREIDDVWMGLNDEVRERTLAWTDGTSVDYRNFCPGEPNNGCGSCEHSGDSDCFRMYPSCSSRSGQWVWGDKPCDLVARYVCQIPSVIECLSNPCLNGGNCTSTPNGTKSCICLPGYSGDLCQIDLDVCETDLCKNGALCMEGLGTNYTCRCVAGYNGEHCESEINECLSNPCANGGSCLDGEGWFFCRCPNGFTGYTCQTDACATFPCLHGSTCVTSGDGPYCECGPGFSGTHCEIVMSKCQPDSCLNNGTCVDVKHHLLCICTANYQGPRCEHDSCKKYVCLHDSECVVTLNGPECKCRPGTFGLHCEINPVNTIQHKVAPAAHATTPEKSGSGLYVFAIICGVGALLIVLVVLAVWGLRRRRRQREGRSSGGGDYVDWGDLNAKVQFQYQKSKLDEEED